MPVKFNGRTYAHFRQAQAAVMRKKGWTKERAARYVAGIEKKMHPKRARYRGAG